MRVGPINLIFNWSGGTENHYRNGEARTRQKGHALTPGKRHAIVVQQVRDRAVVSVDGKTVYSATAVIQGTVTIYPANSTIAISQIEITGTPDPKRKVQGHSHTNTY